MNIKLNIDTELSNLNKLQNLLSKYDNSSIDIHIDNMELKILIVNYFKKLIDVDIDKLGFDLDIIINNDDIYNIKINYPSTEQNEYQLLRKELKANLGNQIINSNNEINSRILLRSMFKESLYYTIENSKLKIVYNNYGELKEKIQLRI